MGFEVYIATDTVAALFCFMMVFLVASQYRNNKERSRALLLSIVSLTLIFISDIFLCFFYNAEYGNVRIVIMKIAAFILFTASATMGYANVQYSLVVIKCNGKTLNKNLKVIVNAIYIASLIVVISAPITRAFYYFNENGSLCYGPLSNLLIIAAVLYTVILLSTTFFYRSALSKRDFQALFLYSICLLLAVVSTLLNANSIKVYVIAAMALFLVVVSNVNEISESFYKNKEKLLEVEKQMAEDQVKLLQTELIEKDLTLAANIQLGSLTSNFPPYTNHENITAYAKVTPAKQVGGDFYDCFEIDKHHICIVVADVSGKGIPAALFMMQTKMSIYSQAKYCMDSAIITKNVNNLLCENNTQMMFATAWTGILDTQNMILQYTNAGHNPPCFFRIGTEYKYMTKRHGRALGITQNFEYEKTEKNLMPGDILFLYTDGVTEANNANKNMFGEDRLITALSEHKACKPKEIVDGISEALTEFVGDAEQFDDITMFALSIRGLE